MKAQTVPDTRGLVPAISIPGHARILCIQVFAPEQEARVQNKNAALRRRFAFVDAWTRLSAR